MNMGGETFFPSMGEILVALFFYLLVPSVIPLVAGIIASKQMPHVSLGIGTRIGVAIGIVTLVALALTGWFMDFSDIHYWLLAMKIPYPMLVPPIVYGAAGAILAWWLIYILNGKIAAGSDGT